MPPINVKVVICSVEKTIKRFGNWSSDVYFWSAPDLESTNCLEDDDGFCVNPRIYIIGVILILFVTLMVLKYYDDMQNADSFE